MKKNILVLLSFVIITNLFAKDWEVLGESEFRTLNIEDKIDYLFYNYPIQESIFTSLEQDFQGYADILIGSEGAACIPYLKEIVETSGYIEMESDPYAMNLIILSYCMHYLRNNNDFSTQDRTWFSQRITGKIIEYLEIFHTIDIITFYGRLALAYISNERLDADGYETWGAFLANEFKSFGFYNLSIFENAGGILMYPFGRYSAQGE